MAHPITYERACCPSSQAQGIPHRETAAPTTATPKGQVSATEATGNGQVVDGADRVAAPPRCRKIRPRPRSMLEARSPHMKGLSEEAPVRKYSPVSCVVGAL